MMRTGRHARSPTVYGERRELKTVLGTTSGGWGGYQVPIVGASRREGDTRWKCIVAAPDVVVITIMVVYIYDGNDKNSVVDNDDDNDED